MNTIIALAEALERASGVRVERLDIQFNEETEIYEAQCLLEGSFRWYYVISEEGTIRKVDY